MIALKIRSRVIQSLADEGQSSHGKASTMSVDGRNVLLAFQIKFLKKYIKKIPSEVQKLYAEKLNDFGLLFRVH